MAHYPAPLFKALVGMRGLSLISDFPCALPEYRKGLQPTATLPPLRSSQSCRGLHELMLVSVGESNVLTT